MIRSIIVPEEYFSQTLTKGQIRHLEMKKAKKNPSRQNRPATGKPAGSASDQAKEPQAPRRLFRDILFGLLVCLVFFALLEAGFRIVAPPKAAAPDDPFVGFSSIQPLFAVQDGRVSIAKNRLRYFNEASFSLTKSRNTFRIFAFGGSTTYGHPFNSQTAFPHWLQELLGACDSCTNYEVINLGGISYASYRIIPLMKETLAYKPDLFVVYTGQNEFLERRSYAGLIEKSPALLSIEAILEKSRAYQALKSAIDSLLWDSQDRISSKKAPTPGEGKTILQDEANAILDRSSGLDLYHRDEQFAQGVTKHFRHNLEAMIELSRSAGIPIIFVAPASNLRDFSPFKSEHDPSLSAREKNDLDKKLASVNTLVKSGRFEEAQEELNTIYPKLTDHAQANFTMAKILDGLGRHDEARKYFIRARDLDVCPLRATSPVEEQIYSVTSAKDVPLIDFKKYVEDRALSDGIATGLAGEEGFLDHVHPSIEYHQKIAELIFQRMLDLGLIKDCKEVTPGKISEIFAEGLKNLDKELFVVRDLNLAKTLKWAGKKDEALSALNRILKVQEGNPEIHKMLGAYALEDGNTTEAINRYKMAVELSGGDPQLKLSLATAYYRSGDRASAKRIYETMVENGEAFQDIIANLAVLYLEENRIDEALKLISGSLDKSKESELLFAPYGLALAMSGDLENGIKWMKRASEAEPGDPSHLYNLAGMYALAGDTPNCFKYLNLAIDRGYSNAQKLKRDQVFQSVRNSSEFYKILDRISQ